MAYQKITCPKCGESHLHVEGGLFVCDVCESTFTKEEEASLEERLEQYHQMNQDIDLGHLRYLIRNELKKDIRDYKVIMGYVLDILKILPEDFQALYFKHLCQYKKDPHMYDLFLTENKNAKISKYEKDFLYPFIIDECQYRSRVAVSEFLRGQNDFDSQEERLEKAMRQRELENDLFANYERDVFICHSSNDNDKILPVIQAIEKDGYTCWYSERNLKKDIDYYYPGIEEAIQSCRIFLVFMSTNSIMSDDVKWEINKAKLLNKKRIEYRLEDRNNNPLLKDFFAGIQWVDGAFKDATDELIDRIYRELEQKEEKRTKKSETKNEPKVKTEGKDLFTELKFNLYIENFDEARKVFSEALKKDFDNPILYQYGILLESENKKNVTPLALKHYERLLQLDPNNKNKYEKEYSFLFPKEETKEEVKKEVKEIVINKSKEKNKDVKEEVKVNVINKTEEKIKDVKEEVKEKVIEEIKEKKIEQEQKTFSLEDALKLYNKKKFDDAIKAFMTLVGKSNGIGEYYIGECYVRGNGVQKDFRKAIEWLRKAASQGHSRAFYLLGYSYEFGYGVSKDLPRAIEYYHKAAELDNIDAQYVIGTLYLSGNGVKKDITKAMEWLRKAAEQGYVYAQMNLGDLYVNEKNDYKSANMWYLKAAEQGSPTAQYNLGINYQEGRGVEKDITKAMEWFQKAAEQGHADAQFKLGYYFETEIKDYESANKWLLKAAEQEHPEAQFYVGYNYSIELFGDNGPSALKWYQKAAEHGNAKAQIALGKIYEYGEDVYGDYYKIKKDLSNAEKWYKKAAEQGDAEGQFSLGILYYLNEELGEQRISKAIDLFIKAASQGHSGALYWLGDAYEFGIGVSKDFSKALEYYHKAAELDDKDAQYKIGTLYLDGREVEKDIPKAMEWFRKAAEQGSYLAQKKLAELYEKQKDFASAVEWYEKANEKGKANKLRLLHPFKSKK